MSMTELEKRCVDALAKAQGLDPHEIAALPISTATGNLLDEVRAVLAEAGKALLSDEAVADAWSALFDAGGSGNEQGVRAAINAALVKIGANQ